MSLGGLLGGAGVVGRAWRVEEEAQRRAHEEAEMGRHRLREAELRMAELGRLEQLRQEMLGAPNIPLPQPFAFQEPLPVQQVGGTPGPVGAPTAARPVDSVVFVNPADPYAHAPRGGTAVAAPAVRAAPTAAAAQPASPAARQIAADRRALSRPFAAAADVFGAPVVPGLNLASWLGERAINLGGGRLIEALTGRDIFPDDVRGRGPRWSPTPFMDRLRQQEQQARQQEPQAQAISPASPDQLTAPEPRPVPPAAARRAERIDGKTTPFDELIQQSALQHGIDPVVFRRLIGTESDFRPNAVSYRGGTREERERFGLGIAQIAAVHGLTREQRLDPNVAIPFAAQLFARYLREANGDYERALMRYKGATSPQGRTAMQMPVSTILAGLPFAQAQAHAAQPPAAPQATAARTPTTSPAATQVHPQAATPQIGGSLGTSDFYLANPQAISLDTQRAVRRRAEVEQLAEMYRRAGMGREFMQTRSQLLDLDDNITHLQGMQALQEFTLANDPRRLAAVWSHYAGVPVGVQPRTDGLFNIVVNGRRTREGVSADQIADLARAAFDQTYRQQRATAAAARNEAMHKADLDARNEQIRQTAQMVREIMTTQARGNIDHGIALLKEHRYEVRPMQNDTLVIIPPFGGVPMVFNPRGQAVVVDGVRVESMSAVPIPGMSPAPLPMTGR